MNAHRDHLTICVAVIAVAVMAVVMSGGAPASIALLVAGLLCPVAMGVVVWLLLRAGSQGAAPPVQPERARDEALR